LDAEQIVRQEWHSLEGQHENEQQKEKGSILRA
jgi:hypothetical protein